MIINMHCRLPCLTDDSFYPLTHSQYTNISNKRIHSPDQIPAAAAATRFRRLEEPIIRFASNYYVLHPPQICHTPSPTLDRIHSKSNYCDLFNLLESSPISQRKSRSIVYKNTHTKFKDLQQRKENRSSTKQQQHDGFFRRVLRQYFCMPITIHDGNLK